MRRGRKRPAQIGRDALTKVRVHANIGGPVRMPFASSVEKARRATPNVAAGRDAVPAMAQSVSNATRVEVSEPLVPQSHVIGVGDDGGAERALGVEAKAPPGSVERYGVARGKRQKVESVEVDPDAVAFEKATDTEQSLGQIGHDGHSREVKRRDDRLIASLSSTSGGSKSLDSQGDRTNGSDRANNSIGDGDLATRVVLGNEVKLTGVRDEVL